MNSATMRWLLFGLAVLVLVIMTVRMWTEREGATETAFRRAEAAADVMAENAARLFDAGEFFLRHADQRVRGRSWDAVAADAELWASLGEFERQLSHVGSLWMLDAAGRLRLTTSAFPAPDIQSSDRDYFRVHLRGDAVGGRPFIGSSARGRVRGEQRFVLSIPRGGDAANGIIVTSLDAAYFHDFAAKLDLPEALAPKMGLLRQDTGERLFFSGGDAARHDNVPGSIIAGARRDATAGRVIAGPALVAWKKLDGWPVVAAVGVQQAAVLEVWGEEATAEIILSALALVGLLGLAYVLWRDEQTAADAAAYQDEYHQRLEDEIVRLRVENHGLRRLEARASAPPAGEGR